MKKIILSIVAVLAVMVSAGAQEAMTKQNYSAKDFTSISISNAFEVQLVKGDTYRVTLEYPADCAQYISVAKQKATLFIGLKNKTPRKWMNGKHRKQSAARSGTALPGWTGSLPRRMRSWKRQKRRNVS